MQLLKLTTLLLLTPLSVLALPAPEAAAIAQPYREEPAPGQDEWSPVPPVPSSTIAQRSEIVKRGFGCPGNPQQCNDHCISLGGGRSGGYCGGGFWFFHPTCICVFG